MARRVCVWLIASLVMVGTFIGEVAADESFTLTWAFRYEDRIGLHYGRVRLSGSRDRKIDATSPLGFRAVFQPSLYINSNGSALFENKDRYRRPGLARYDFYDHLNDPKPKAPLLFQIKSFDGVELSAELQEVIYGASARRVKLTLDPDGNFYGVCDGSYLREYRLTKDDAPALGKDWRLRSVQGTEYWLLIEANGIRLYKDSEAVRQALEGGARVRQADMRLAAAAEGAVPVAAGTYQAVNQWYENREEPRQVTLEPGTEQFQHVDLRQGEDLIVRGTITDWAWAQEADAVASPGGIVGWIREKVRPLVGRFSAGKLVGEERVTSAEEILKLDPSRARYQIVRADSARRTVGVGRTEAEAVASAVVEASRVIRTRVRQEVRDWQRAHRVTNRAVETATASGRVEKQSDSRTFNAIKQYRVTKLQKIDHSGGGRYEAEIEYIPGKAMPKSP